MIRRVCVLVTKGSGVVCRGVGGGAPGEGARDFIIERERERERETDLPRRQVN